MRTRFWPALLLTAVLAGIIGVSPAGAADADDTPADIDTAAATSDTPLLDGWEFEFVPYMWLPAMHGTVGAAGRTVQLDVGYMDMLDLIGDHFSAIAGMAHFEARHDRFAGFIDFTGMKVDTNDSASLEGIDSKDFPGVSTTRIDTKVHFKQDTIFFEFGAAFRLLELAMPKRERPFTLEALAGGRYMYYWTSVSAEASTKITGLPHGSQAERRAASAHATIDWVDPFIGGRFAVPLTNDIEFSFRGDIGGFGAGSDLAWSLVSGCKYDVPWHPFGARTWFAAGYKVLAFDYDTGNAQLDFQYRGPTVGLGFVF
jgi:hypothetical protein